MTAVVDRGVGVTGDSESELLSAAPVLRWMGSKRRTAPHIIATIGSVSGTYYEPFAGSAAVFFGLAPLQGQLGDLNASLMATYEIMRADPDLLHASVSALEADEESYYKYRTIAKTAKDQFERATLFVYLNRYCFNGIYRTNRRNEFNVPYGTTTGALPSVNAFRACALALTNCELVVADFTEIVDRAGVGDVVYLDPPYPSERPAYGEYGYGTFGLRDLARLEATALRLADAGATVLVSLPGKVAAEMPKLSKWGSIDHKLSYSVAAASSLRKRAREVTLYSRAP